MKKWKILAIGWPLLCFTFAGIIIFQPGRGGEEKIADVAFTVFPLIFFAIGMKIQRRLIKERTCATMPATATVTFIKNTVHIGEGNKRIYFPEYEFQVGDRTCHVKSPSGFNHCYVKKGEQVELYYAPDDPNVFYVPVMYKHDKRWAVLLCGIGIAYPLIGLFAPWIRALVPL